MTSRALERAVVRRFNEILEVFPPGVGPRDVIDEGFRRDWIHVTNGMYRITVSR